MALRTSDQYHHCRSSSSELPWVDSLFQQPWWLDAVAPDCWEDIVLTRNGTVVARLPYVVKKRRGLTILTQPPLTPMLGPWIRPLEGKPSHRSHYELEVIRELIVRLPRFDLFHQRLSPSVTNWLPFYWAGFTATVHYTYRIAHLTNLDSIWDQFDETTRRNIRKTAKSLEVRTDMDIDAFLALSAKTFQHHGLDLPYRRELVRRLDEACASRGQRRIFYAVDGSGTPHAAVYIVWDGDAAYYLMGGLDRQRADRGATALVLWEAMQFCSTVTTAFDFEGSMIESIERYFRRFGATRIPMFFVSGHSRRMGVILGFRALVHEALGRSGGFRDL